MTDFAKKAKALHDSGAIKSHDKEGGDFEFTPHAAGPCAARFVSYVEVGKQPQRAYQGKAKDPALEVILQFELYGKRHAIVTEAKDGEPGSVSYPIITVTQTVKSGTRAGYTKLLDAMSYGRDIPVMPMMLGEVFKLNIVHNEVPGKDGAPAKVYANIKDKNGAWQVSAPVVQKFDEDGDPVGDPIPIKGPESKVAARCLLWSAPDKAQWESLYIGGTRKTKDAAGVEKEVTKNWMQEKAKKAVDYTGSALESLLMQLEDSLPEMDTDAGFGDMEPEYGEDPTEEELANDGISDDPLAGVL